MHIAHILGRSSPEHGGPANELPVQCRAQAKAGHWVTVRVLEGFPGTSPAIRMEAPIDWFAGKVQFPSKLGCSAELKRRLRLDASPDVYHLHGTWLRAMYYGAVEAKRRRRPYLLHLTGTYEPYSLKTKWFRKCIARCWFQDRLLREAACLHVNSLQEGENIRVLGFKTPIAIIPGGVDLEEITRRNPVLLSESPWRELKGRPFVLFLSRLHPKKGLDLLIRAWATIRKSETGNRKSDDWMLVIAGTGAPEYVSECRQLAAQFGIANQCFWAGQVNEMQKSWLYTNAQCYILPTSSENFGTTVVESLAYGTPVITTVHTPWADLKKRNCGWVVDNTVDALCPALCEALKMDAVVRGDMGQAGQKLVHEAYSLESVLKSIEAVYKWVTGVGPEPGCIM